MFTLCHIDASDVLCEKLLLLTDERDVVKSLTCREVEFKQRDRVLDRLRQYKR